MVVAIDGPAGSGKSVVAERVAAKTGFAYLNSGSLYRAISKKVLESGNPPEDHTLILKIASSCKFEVRGNELLLNGEPVSGIQTDSIDRWSAIHSSILEVRLIVNRQLRAVAAGKDIVVMGRDIGTVVFPDAEVKIYLDASIEARAARRYRQGLSNLNEQQIRAGIEQRDSIDRSKPFGKLERASGAVYIDTSDLTIDQVCETVVREILKAREINRELNTGNEL
jgi:cytidylate kinase